MVSWSVGLSACQSVSSISNLVLKFAGWVGGKFLEDELEELVGLLSVLCLAQQLEARDRLVLHRVCRREVQEALDRLVQAAAEGKSTCALTGQ